MRTLIIILLSLTIFSCKNDDIIVPENLFAEFNDVEKQNFDIGLVSDTIITGKNGTKIYFSRDALNVNNNIPITIELLELYDFIDILNNNIATVTTKNKLLETSGVIFLDVKAENKSIKLKNNRQIKVVFPRKNLKDNFIYFATIDSVGNYKWRKDEALAVIQYPDTAKAKKYRVKGYFIEKKIPLDSLKYYEDFVDRQTQAEDFILNQFENDEIGILLKQFGWINLDIPVLTSEFLDCKIEIVNSDFDYFHIYILYSGLNSTLTYFDLSDQITLNKVPFFENTFMLITAKKNGRYFAKQIKLDLNQNKYSVELKQISQNDLKDLLLVQE